LKAELIGSLSVNPADKSNRLEVQLLQHSQLENYLGGSNAIVVGGSNAIVVEQRPCYLRKYTVAYDAAQSSSTLAAAS
jgi:hypothetical protein